MKKTLIIAAGLASLTASASMLDITSSKLSSNINTLDNSTPLSIQANATAGDVLVIGTFSTAASAQSGEGSWQLSLNNQAQTSKAITRTLDGNNDIGIASVTHIFTNITSGSIIDLQHKTTTGVNLTTSGGNLIAIPLTVSSGEKLNHGFHRQETAFQTNSTSFSATGIKTTVQLDRASNNGVYMAASFNAQSISGAETGSWQLQYRNVNDLTWTDTGTQIDRKMSSSADVGSVTLYALEEDLPPGEYEVQLVGKSETGATVQTLNGSLAAVSLSYTNATGGGYFDGFSVESDAMSPIDGPYDGAQATLTLEGAGSGIYSSMSFNSEASKGANQTGGFDLFLTNATSTANNQQNERFFDDVTDIGSGGSAGYFSNLTAGDYTLIARAKNVTGPISTSNVTLVGFATEAIPEPAVASLIVGFGISLLAARRIFKS